MLVLSALTCSLFRYLVVRFIGSLGIIIILTDVIRTLETRNVSSNKPPKTPSRNLLKIYLKKGFRMYDVFGV